MDLQTHVSDSLPAFALGCLDQEERAEVQRHLDQCELCRMELETYQPVVGDLGLAARQVEPPAALRDKVMAGAVQKQPASPVTRQPGKSIWQRLSMPWAAVSFALVLVLVVSNLYWYSQKNPPSNVVGSTQFMAVALAGTDSAPAANGVLIISHDGTHGTLIVDDLPPLDAQHVYQLWLRKDDTPTSGGTFTVQEGGYGALWVASDQPLINYQRFGITVEPVGGSPGPTGPKVLGGDLNS